MSNEVVSMSSKSSYMMPSKNKKPRERERERERGSLKAWSGGDNAEGMKHEFS